MGLAVPVAQILRLLDLVEVFRVLAGALRVVAEVSGVADLAEAEAVVAAEVVEVSAAVEADQEAGVPGKPPGRPSGTGAARISRFTDRRRLPSKIPR